MTLTLYGAGLCWLGLFGAGASIFGHFWFLFFALLGSFLLLGKFHWFHIWGSPMSKSLACLFISSNLGGVGGGGKERWRLGVHLVTPTLIFYCMEGEFEQIIMKLRVSIKENNKSKSKCQ